MEFKLKLARNIKRVCVCGLWALLLFPFWGQTQTKRTTSFPPAAIINSEQRQLHSKIVDQDYELYISLPDGYAAGDATYPVLYVTDGNTYFGLMADITRNLQWGSEMPEMIIVGIGYPLNTFASDDEKWGKWLAWRMRDLSPSPSAQSDEAFGTDSIKSGGGPQFAQFLEEELFPFIEKEYRAQNTNRTYAGFSLGGLFGLYALFQKPKLFHNYILGSASIWYDDKMILGLEKRYSDVHDDLVAKVFLSAGSLEEEINSGMVRNMLEMNSVLRSRNYKGLVSEAVVLEGETHMSGPSVSFQRGLRFLFRN